MMEGLSSTISRRILKYFEHLMRREGENLEKLIILGKVRERFIDQIRKHTGVGSERYVSMASDSRVAVVLEVQFHVLFLREGYAHQVKIISEVHSSF